MSDGHMNIIVYNYLGRLKRTALGRSFVEDKDDWDAEEKTYKWVKSDKGFALNDGVIFMDADMPGGKYDLVVDVSDNSRVNDHARSYIHVEVKIVPEIAFQNHVNFFKIFIFKLYVQKVFKKIEIFYLFFTIFFKWFFFVKHKKILT